LTYDERTKENPKIMIVEDDSRMAFLYKSILEEKGYQVVIKTETMDEAIQIFNEVIASGKEKEKPQVAILDRKLPDGDGVELGKTLLSLDPAIKILLASGDNVPWSMVQQVGFKGLLKKPFPIGHLLSAISSSLTTSSSYEATNGFGAGLPERQEEGDGRANSRQKK
jgi:DNA-binding response OmpR family regulator